MNNLFERPDEDAFIRTALSDETWQAFYSELRNKAVGRFGSANRRRRARKLAVQCFAFGIIAAAGLYLAFPRPNAPNVRSASTSIERATPPLPRSVITEQQMLDMFPPGSCLLAEVNGQKQLVFLDPPLAERGFPIATRR